MPRLIEPTTERLLLRQWRQADHEPFARLNADEDVMTYFPKTLNRDESDAMAAEIEARIDTNGWGFWAVERRDNGAFIGFVGLNRPRSDLPFSPCVEIGWRLSRAAWGRGYATEAARAALRVGFDDLGLDDIVAFTPLDNQRSRAVMTRLGMTGAGTFEHPEVPAGHSLRVHWLYRLTRRQWQQQAGETG